jgi:hypothetical protein
MGANYSQNGYKRSSRSQLPRFHRHFREPGKKMVRLSIELPDSTTEEKYVFVQDEIPQEAILEQPIKPEGIIKPSREPIIRHHREPIGLETIIEFMRINGRDEPRKDNPVHATALRYLKDNPSCLGLNQEPAYSRFEVTMIDHGLVGRTKRRGTSESPYLFRETDVVHILDSEQGPNLVLVECVTGTNGSSRMRKQLEDAMDYCFINFGLIARAFRCKVKVVSKEVRRVDHEEWIYDPRTSPVNPSIIQ